MKIQISVSNVERVEDRLKRAQQMGFDTSRVWYHGTTKDFDEFDRYKIGPFSSPDTYGCIFLTDSAKVASDYADQGPRIHIDGNAQLFKRLKAELKIVNDKLDKLYLKLKDQDIRKSDDYWSLLKEQDNLEKQINAAKGGTVGEGANVMPLYVRGKTKVVNANGKDFSTEFSRHQIEDAKHEGFDNLMLESYKDGTKYMGLAERVQDILIVFNPINIRSVHAKFDTAKSNSSKLLASTS